MRSFPRVKERRQLATDQEGHRVARGKAGTLNLVFDLLVLTKPSLRGPSGWHLGEKGAGHRNLKSIPSISVRCFYCQGKKKKLLSF